ncbi:uncharacterized protein EI90DRAFT_3015183 [Cantharellus anzutake]|uniref:uncharacterized protein n=1 Tax=Cantharellus anzutake TaxID=1750568 RepID=UPI001903FF70|nr:uncharacterized protein EI90DRAFT_3015183 [Cantharellus anzutake]KAF8334151.1 hypothetical protein EI90DRAFT_3015183 [Cantharellus anzutake]
MDDTQFSSPTPLLSFQIKLRALGVVLLQMHEFATAYMGRAPVQEEIPMYPSAVTQVWLTARGICRGIWDNSTAGFDQWPPAAVRRCEGGAYRPRAPLDVVTIVVRGGRMIRCLVTAKKVESQAEASSCLRQQMEEKFTVVPPESNKECGFAVQTRSWRRKTGKREVSTQIRIMGGKKLSNTFYSPFGSLFNDFFPLEKSDTASVETEGLGWSCHTPRQTPVTESRPIDSKVTGHRRLQEAIWLTIPSEDAP